MLAQLCHGYDFLGDGFGRTDPDLDAMRRVWEQYRETLIEEEAQHNGLAHRAWGWWAFDSSEPRDEDLPEVAQLARMGLLTNDEKTLLREEFIRKKDSAEEEYSNAEWPVAIGQALEIVGALSPSEINALRKHEHESEEAWDDE